MSQVATAQMFPIDIGVECFAHALQIDLALILAARYYPFCYINDCFVHSSIC
jgi:hypothetical protein